MTNVYNKGQDIKGVDEGKIESKDKIVTEIQEELDVPFYNNFMRENNLDEVENRQKLYIFDKIKGHKLLGWCIAVLVFIFIIEEWKHSGKTSETATSIIEIFKILIFSLTGFLFGTKDNGDK